MAQRAEQGETLPRKSAREYLVDQEYERLTRGGGDPRLLKRARELAEWWVERQIGGTVVTPVLPETLETTDSLQTD